MEPDDLLQTGQPKTAMLLEIVTPFIQEYFASALLEIGIGVLVRTEAQLQVGSEVPPDLVVLDATNDQENLVEILHRQMAYPPFANAQFLMVVPRSANVPWFWPALQPKPLLIWLPCNKVEIQACARKLLSMKRDG